MKETKAPTVAPTIPKANLTTKTTFAKDQERVTISFRIEGIEYTSLAANEALKNSVETTIRAIMLKAMPDSLKLKESDVMVKLAEGSVLATVTVATPSTTTTESLASKIHTVATSDGFNHEMITAIIGIDGINDVTTGNRAMKVTIPIIAQDGPVTLAPTAFPTNSPKAKITPTPTRYPTTSPTPSPTRSPTRSPTPNPTCTPTDSPTPQPSKGPTRKPTEEPTALPTDPPTPCPTCGPADKVVHVVQINGSKHQWEMPAPGARPTVLTDAPTPFPTKVPTGYPTEEPTSEPTADPSSAPTEKPTASPTIGPTASPTEEVTMEETKPDPNEEEPCAKTAACAGVACPKDLCPDGKSRRQVGDVCCSCGEQAQPKQLA